MLFCCYITCAIRPASTKGAYRFNVAVQYQGYAMHWNLQVSQLVTRIMYHALTLHAFDLINFNTYGALDARFCQSVHQRSAHLHV